MFLRKIEQTLNNIFRFNRHDYFLRVEDYLARHLHGNPKYQDPKRLSLHEHKVFSQNGEDGIIAEIFRRIGTTNCFFVEFGCGKHGTENNSLFLLYQGWSGRWFEGKEKNAVRLRERLAPFVQSGRLSIQAAIITAENINTVFGENKVPKEFDLLSIDIDSNDYWVWKALDAFSPRVVVIEYNSMYPPDVEWIMKYNPERSWGGNSHFGASLKSFELLGKKKGYSLVGCNFNGANAFFVRDDLVEKKFFAPFDAETHYEPPRYFLEQQMGHPREVGNIDAG